jgi:hypothetical protein
MSHITTTKGTLCIPKECAIHVKEAIEQFCNTCEFVQGESHYRTWKDNHNGKLVGDWPLPEGWTEAMVGENADHIIRVKDERLKEKFKCNDRNDSRAPYEIGLVSVRAEFDENGNVVKAVPDPDGEHYVLMTDWWSNGNGLLNEPGIGARKMGKHPQTGEQVELSFSDLYMHYQMKMHEAEAERVGDTLQYEQNEDGTLKVNADGSVVAWMETQARLGVR